MEANVTCRTDNCGNKDITILVPLTESEIVWCGVCNIQIEDVIPVG
jgi:hypothetical protein